MVILDRQHTTATTTTLVRGEGQWRRVCWRLAITAPWRRGRRKGATRGGEGFDGKEETWCSTAGGATSDMGADRKRLRCAPWQRRQLAERKPPSGLSAAALNVSATRFSGVISCVSCRT